MSLQIRDDILSIVQPTFEFLCWRKLKHNIPTYIDLAENSQNEKVLNQKNQNIYYYNSSQIKSQDNKVSN